MPWIRTNKKRVRPMAELFELIESGFLFFVFHQPNETGEVVAIAIGPDT